MESTIIERVREGKFTLIAEIGVNYYDIAAKDGISPMEAAKLMIKEAKEAGIHAVKFQTYKAETIAAKALPNPPQKSPPPPSMSCLRSLTPSVRPSTKSLKLIRTRLG